MSTRSQRINVTLDPIELELVCLLSRKRKVSRSSMIKKMVEDWLEEYEEMKLIHKIEKRVKEKNGYISHEEFTKITKYS